MQYKNSDYDIYEDGRCFSHKTNKWMTPQMTTKYPTYNLTINGVKRKTKVHRMVAETFLPNPNNKPFVNHKDGDTHNFNLSNLEWVTAEENAQHAIAEGLKPKSNQNAIYYTADIEGEEWRPIRGYRNYLISNCGRVMNKDTKRLLKGCISNSGYPEVNLYQNNHGKTYHIHPLVYSAFADDYDLEGFVINHIDGNKKNNHFENLEKITRSQNNLHAVYEIQTHGCAKQIAKCSLNGEILEIFPSLAEARRKTGVTNISRAASNQRTAGGFVWKYIDN